MMKLGNDCNYNCIEHVRSIFYFTKCVEKWPNKQKSNGGLPLASLNKGLSQVCFLSSSFGIQRPGLENSGSKSSILSGLQHILLLF